MIAGDHRIFNGMPTNHSSKNNHVLLFIFRRQPRRRLISNGVSNLLFRRKFLNFM